MSHQFLIDNRFLFIPHHNRIEDVTNGNFITLITPATRCLETLLLNRRLVTHSELYTSGWSDSAREPSPASLYQNILLIRKAFKELTNTDLDYILTIPRKGFVFKNDATVDITEKISTAPSEVDFQTSGNIYYQTEKKKPQQPFVDRRKILSIINLTLIIGCAILLTAVMKKAFFAPRENIFSEIFTPYREEGNCKYYLEKENTASLIKNMENNSLIQNLWQSAADESGAPCMTYPWRYIIFFEHENKVRVLACTRPDDDDPSQECVTLFKRMG